MKCRFLPIFYFTFSSFVFADPLSIQVQVQNLKEISDKITKNSPKDATTNPYTPSIHTLTTQLIQKVDDGNYPSLYQLIQQSSSYTAIPDDYSKALSLLKKEVKKHLEESQTTELNELTKLLDLIKSEILSSKQPEDLDELLSIVSTKSAQFSRSYSSEQNKELSSLQTKISNSPDILSEWQNYLIAENLKDSKACRRALENLSRSLTRTPIIPRSHILRLLNPRPIPEETDSTPQTTETPATPEADRADNFTSFPSIQSELEQGAPLAKIVLMLKNLPPAQHEDSNVTRFYNTIVLLQSFTSEKKKASFREIADEIFTDNYISKFMRSSQFKIARNRVLMPSLRSTHKKALENLKPIPDSPEQLLDDVFSYHMNQQDWPNVLSVIEDQKSYYKLANGRAPQEYQYKSEAITSIARADAAVAANELQIAISNYRSAVSKTDDPKIFAAGFNGLHKLKQSHPKEFLEESEFAKANILLELESRLARYNYTRRNSHRPSHSDNDINPKLQSLIKETVQGELEKTRANTLDRKLENSSDTKTK